MASFSNGATYSSIRTLLNNTGLRKNNLNASQGIPGTGNDSSQSYEVGSFWLDSANSIVYVATDVTVGAAVWTEVSSTSTYGNADVQSYLDAQGYSNVDLDAQTLSWDSANANLSISGGNTVTLSGLGGGTSYGDADVQSYLDAQGYSNVDLDAQTLTWDQANANIIISGGNQITLTGITVFDQSLNTTDNVQFNQVTAANVITTGVGAPVFDSASTITLTAPDGVIVNTGPLRLPNLTTTERNGLTASNGDLIYNTTANRIQGYQNGAWINIDDGTAA